jgi:serpin B
MDDALGTRSAGPDSTGPGPAGPDEASTNEAGPDDASTKQASTKQASTSQASTDLTAQVRAIDATAAALYRELGASGANTAFSPASIAIALETAMLGARGGTAAELARFLTLTGAHDPAAGLRGLAGMLVSAAGADGAEAGGELTFRMPNTLWVQSGLPLRPEFRSALNGLPGISVHEADFRRAAGAVLREINELVAEQTAGKIKDLLSPGMIGPLTRLVLANAIYLKAPWASPFPARATSDEPFNLAGGGTVTVAMMHVTHQLAYARGDGHQFVLLPYTGGKLAMAIVLPDGPLGPLREQVAAAGLRGTLRGARQTRVRLGLPRFRVTAQFELANVLRTLGVAAAFTDAADFSGITAAEPLTISAVAHKAYVDVDEQGTEAAAATAIGFARAMAAPPRQPVVMTVDRPFLFAITERATGAPLFLGQVTNPALR